MVPVVAAHGDESSPHHQEAARVLAELAPDSELHVVAGAGHGVHLTHPSALADLVKRGLESAEPASPAALYRPPPSKPATLRSCRHTHHSRTAAQPPDLTGSSNGHRPPH